MRMTQVRATLATFLATMAMAWETRTLYRDGLYLTHAFMIAGAMAALGLAVRLLAPNSRWYAWPLWAAQTVLGGGILLWLHRGDPLPSLLLSAVDGIESGTAPLGQSKGLSLVFLVLPWLAFSLLELFVQVGKMPGLSILPLLAWYTVFALVPQPQARILALVLAGVSYVAILAADTTNRASRWRGGLKGDSGTGSDVDTQVLRVAAIVLVPTLLASWVIGSTMPLFQPEELSGGNGTVSMADPKLDLRQNLHASRRREVLTYSSDVPGGQRLHLAVLTDLSPEGWNVRPFPAMALPVGSQAFPAAPGQSTDIRTRNTHVEVQTFPSQYLPLPYAPRTANLTKQWGVDAETLMVYTMEAQGPDSVNHMVYDVTSAAVEPSAEALGQVRTARSGDSAEGVPARMPESVKKLTADITGNARTPLEKASALQAYFRNGTFTYDLDVAPQQGGFAGLEQFLFVDRTGYCEQYASAYAAMARIAGLPSRVVIGFLPGDAMSNGTYSVANLDMHAWPEVWFDGYGWLPFEPTPPDVSGPAPAYSEVDVPPVLESTPTPSASVEQTSQAPIPTQQPDQPIEDDTKQPVEIPWPLIAAVLGVVALGLLAAAPGWFRGRRRAARLALRSTGPDKTMALWHELRDTVLDLGLPWPEESPRGLVASLENRVSAPTAEGLGELAVAVERVRFATTPGEAPAHGAQAVENAVREITSSASQQQRTRARWWPGSLWAGWLSPRRRRGDGATGRAARS